MDSNWKPTVRDVIWARVTVESVKEGGILILPASLLVFRVLKAEKRLVLTNPEVLADPDSREVFERSKVVFPLATGLKVEIQQ